MEPLSLPHVPEVLDRDRLLVARLEVAEHREIICQTLCGGSWFEYLDAIGDDGGTLMTGIVVDLAGYDKPIDEDRDGMPPLIEGSLFWFRSLGLHPAFRGQNIGARLLAHALFHLHRCEFDLAVLEAFPMKTIFDSKVPPRTVAAVRKLVSYYEWVGFKRSRPEERIRCRAVPMHSYFGSLGLPVRGFPGFSRFPRGK